MNQFLTRIVCSFFIVISLSFSGKLDLNNTTTQLADNTDNKSNLFGDIVKETSINYPTSLQNHIDESLDYVQEFSEKKRDYIINIYKKGKSFFPKVVAVLKRYQLPQELKVLIALESAFNSNAVSSAGAVGYWQMMDGAAKEYGLHILNEDEAADPNNKKRDDRTNFSKSTIAAAKYLKDRCRELNNDLLLMVASYNCGAGNVRKAIRKSGKTDAGFWDIKKYLPSETRAYVMNFIAMNVVFENYDKFINNKMVFNAKSPLTGVAENGIQLNTPLID
ncbi:MAG TPA: lytic transglycosylase domain-containing protein [Chitinophagaceae bacterium]|nr:lytic transglycosylase domain-containing protein [Chitinophagaceae bacterium]